MEKTVKPAFCKVRPITSAMQLKRPGLDRILRLHFMGFYFLKEWPDESSPIAGAVMGILNGTTIFASIYRYKTRIRPSEYRVPFFVDGDFFVHPQPMMEYVKEKFDGWAIQEKPNTKDPLTLRRPNYSKDHDAIFVKMTSIPFAVNDPISLFPTMEKVIDICTVEDNKLC